MTKFQKVIYKTAKLICTNNEWGDLIDCYKARLQYSKKNSLSFTEVKQDYENVKKIKECV